MKIQIRTAHGFLSFQPAPTPDGKVEIQYRQSPGLWEEVELIGLELPVPPPTTEPPPTNPPPVESVDGVPSAVQPVERTAAYISRVKNYLMLQGYSLVGPCGAFCIVEHAVWWMGMSDPTVGLLDKPDGNMCRGYATDIVMFRNQLGAIVDVLGDGGNANNPQWNVSSPGEVELDRWRPPVEPAAKGAYAVASAMKASPTPTPTKKR